MPDRTALRPFLDKAYDEAFALLVELRDFLAERNKIVASELPAVDRLLLTQELTRLTRRLTEIMPWLLLQKAVDAGEVSEVEALRQAAANLPDDDSGDTPSQALRSLPSPVRGMIGRARRLHGEVIQLRHNVRVTAEMSPSQTVP